jgi:hypothetical protein
MFPAACQVQQLLSRPIPWSQDDLQGLALPGYESFDPRALPWAEASTGGPMPNGCQLTKKSRHRWVLGFEWRGEKLYAKRGIPRLIRQRVSWTLRGSKAQREFAIGRAFVAAGITVPEPVFYAHTKSSESFLVTRALPENWMSFIEWARQHGLHDEDLAEVARYTRWLHGLSAFHADYRADHIFRTDAPPGSPPHESFALIDLDGSRVGRVPSTRLRTVALYQFFLSLVPVGMTRERAVEFCHVYAPKPSDCNRLDPNAIYDRVERSWARISTRKRK